MMKIKNILDFFSKKEKNASAVTYRTLLYINDDFVATNYNSPKLALEGYIKCIIAYKCISLIADNCALMNYDLFNVQSGQKKKVEKHPVLDLLRSPYYQMSKTDFIRTVISQKKIYGNAYIEKRYAQRGGDYNPGKPLFLFPLRPDFIIPRNGRNHLNDLYTYRDEYNSSIDFPVNIEGKSNIIHIKEFNPQSYFQGLSPIVPAAYAIDLHTFINKHNNALMKNGARPSGYLKVPAGVELSENTILRLREDIKTKYTGAENTGKTVMLESGIEWVQTSMSPQDGDFKNLKDSSAHEIGLAFNVPIELLNTIPAKYDNLAAAYDQLYSDAVVPESHSYCDNLNINLVPLYGDNLILEPNFDHTPVMLRRKIKTMTELNSIGFITKNEKRVLSGMEERPDGDEYDSKSSIKPEESKFIENEINAGSTIEEAIHNAAVIYGGQ